MTKNLENIRLTEEGADTKDARAYEPPRVLSRERLESAANVCTGFGMKEQPGATSPFGGLCGQAGLQS